MDSEGKENFFPYGTPAPFGAATTPGNLRCAAFRFRTERDFCVYMFKIVDGNVRLVVSLDVAKALIRRSQSDGHQKISPATMADRKIGYEKSGVSEHTNTKVLFRVSDKC